MRWFKHFADARHNPKLRAATKLLGEAAYARYFKLLEIVGQRGGKADDFTPLVNLDEPHTDLDWLAEELGISRRQARKTLDIFARLRLIDPDSLAARCVEIQGMTECLDEWTSRKLRSNSRVSCKKLPTDLGQSESQSERERERNNEEEDANK
jgi:hypothetical protein